MGDDNNSTLSTSNSSIVGDEQQPNVFVYTQELKTNVPSGGTELEDDLTYQYNQTKQELGEQKETLNQQTSPKTNYTAPPKHKIPVLGQLPNAAPLLIGETKLLSPMTPLQWRTILRSVDILHNRTAATFDSNATINLAKVDAAPLVAIVAPNSTVATLAAIIGIQRGKGGKKDRAETSIYDEMAQSLSESTPYFGDSSQVRVLGVGRAELSEFSTALRERIQRISVANDDVEPDATKVVELVQDKVYHNNGDLVIMASMDLVMDDGSRLSERQETEYTDRVSPIHSLNKLSRCAFQLMMLHKDRQKLVQELQAAQSCSRAYDYDDERIGREEETSSAADLCPENKSNLSEEALRVSTLDNYGLGSTRTAVSDLAALSRVLRDQILPYYSPSKSKTEEFDYSLLSWVALQSLAPYVNATTMKDMMELTNPAERMEEMHIVMSSHKDALKELADAKAEELQALVGSVSADIAAKKSSNSRMASKMKRLVNQNNNTLTDEEVPVNGTSNLATAISKIPFRGHQPKRKRPSFFLEHNETENYSYSSAVITNSTNTATDCSTTRDETSPLTADPDNKSSKPYDKNKIPVLGPFINQPPLLIGASQWLSPPTPLQWKAIELCVENMHSMSDSKSTFATIDAAPLVAILAPNSEVATLAAIVGIRKAKTDGSTRNEPVSDLNTTFDEYLASRYRRSSPYDSDDGEVRLLGIGRARLSNFTTLVRENPDVYEKIEGEDDINNGEGDEEISFVDDDIGCVDISEVESGEEISFVEEDIGCADDIAEGQTLEQKEEGEDIEKELQGEAGLVVIADMRLVLDGPDIEVEQEEEFSKRRSSIHAVNRMSAWASKLYFLHQDRQQLVQELQATKSRMKVAVHFDMTHNSNGSPAPVLSQEALRVVELDNYGLGTTRSAFSDLRALSSVLKEQLQPYYSESRFSTEEFDYAAISWVALQSMETYMEEDKLKEIMASANTVDRMEQLYNVMLEHKMALKELVALRKHVLGDQTLEAERNGKKIPSSEAEFEFDPDTIADMRVILDGPILERQYDEYTKRSSPVHALNKLSQWASRLSFVHKDLQKIARGLQTAQKRIDRASKRWEDWDGIGDLFEEDDADKSIRDLMSFLLRGAHNPTVASSITHDTMVKSADGVSFMLPLSEKAKRVAQLDNNGLGSTRSSSSDLQTLAKALKEQVKPYFSPSRVETEEFHYCLTTWVALQLVKPYIEDATLKDIMKKQNTAERMERLYDIMMDHKKTLQELADAKCQEMRGCGADYTGLF